MAAMRQEVNTERSDIQDSTFLASLDDLDVPVLDKIGDEVLMRGVAVLTGWGWRDVQWRGGGRVERLQIRQGYIS